MTGDQKCARAARYLLDVRKARNDLFPNELFDEAAWDMLLHLFVAHADNRRVTADELAALSDSSVSAGHRWIASLVQDGLIEPHQDGDDLVLTHKAIDDLRAFLGGTVFGHLDTMTD